MKQATPSRDAAGAARGAFEQRSFRAADGIILAYRVYGAPSERSPLLCLPGLTRNARDFHELALHCQTDRQVFCLDFRGRGRSEHADPRTYTPPVYVQDVIALLAHERAAPAVLVGTSLGGLVTMGVAATDRSLLKGAILNDIGPELDPVGASRIGGAVGSVMSYPSLDAAAVAIAANFRNVYPEFTTADWRSFALRLGSVSGSGAFSYDYDQRIGDIVRQTPPTPPGFLWPLFHALRDTPVLAIRGALSDLLSHETFVRMAVDMPLLTRLEVANRGHVPLLSEPECLNAIDRFLSGL